MNEPNSFATTTDYGSLSDIDVIAAIRSAVVRERASTAHVIAALAELDARGLYLGEGCSSIFTYCTQVLRLSEHAAYGRITASRAARRFPAIFNYLADGGITLTTITLLSPHLTLDNHAALLEAARFKSRRDVERQVATLVPRPDIEFSLCKVPESRRDAVGLRATDVPATVAGSSAQGLPKGQRFSLRALAPHRYYLKVTVAEGTRLKLQRAQDLLRHSNPDADPALIIDRALTLLVEQLERVKYGATRRPRLPTVKGHESSGTGRHVPNHIRRFVWKRDGGRCVFVGSKGRCSATAKIEFHHIIPLAKGGPTSIENLQLRCRPHNVYEAEKDFGRSKARVRRTAASDPKQSRPG